MKKLLLLLTIFLGACTNVPPGNVGLKVHLYGGNKGVDVEELPVGRYWIGWGEELHLFPVFTQNYCWTKGNNPECGSPNDEEIKFQSIEGTILRADVGITFNIKTGFASSIFQKFRKGVPELVDNYIRNNVRDALIVIASKRTAEDVYGPAKAEVMNEVTKLVKDKLDPQGIIIEDLYWLSDVRIPDDVRDRINAKVAAIQASQQSRNEVEKAKAEADKSIETARGQAESILAVARAQAEANRLVSASLTPELVRYKSIEKWTGELPRFSGGMTPFIDVSSIEGKK